jgi:hypothetical protein
MTDVCVIPTSAQTNVAMLVNGQKRTRYDENERDKARGKQP